jgi:lysozyme family protein
MAEFVIAKKKTGGNEGGYSNNPNDKGKETYDGISRVNWPKWSGWVLIDGAKTLPGFPQDLHAKDNWKIIDTYLAKIPRLDELVTAFYKVNFWDTICGDLIVSQDIANTLYDWEVNSGEGYPAKAIQILVGSVVDGDIGPNTVKKINAYPDQVGLLNDLRKSRVSFVKKIVIDDPSQAEFLDGWITRAQRA